MYQKKKHGHVDLVTLYDDFEKSSQGSDYTTPRAKQ